jgi:tetraacyldisaccharide 4'-kinase
MGVIQREFESDRRDIESWVMLPLAGLYALGWMSYELMYKLGIKRPQQPHSPIVCIGNLRVGGSGKSPVVIHVAQVLQGQGREVVIGCNGYRSPRQEGASLAPAGPLDPREWGDEPAMIREALPDVPLVVGRKRVDAAALVAAHHPGAVLLMDDGFQHLPLRKDVSIVLDPERPVNSFLSAKAMQWTMKSSLPQTRSTSAKTASMLGSSVTSQWPTTIALSSAASGSTRFFKASP